MIFFTKIVTSSAIRRKNMKNQESRIILTNFIKLINNFRISDEFKT